MSTITETKPTAAQVTAAFQLLCGKGGCSPIALARQHYLTKAQLVAANNESIRLGMSRNLVTVKIAKFNDGLCFPVVEAWEHTSREGLHCIRLFLLVGKNPGKPVRVFLDVTHATWAEIKRNKKVVCG
jgi:hypothetical protein